MRLTKKAAAGIPIRLTAVFIVLTLSIPLLANSMERTETDMAAAELGNEMGRVVDAASVVYFSGSGSSKTIVVDVPPGCEIRMGDHSGDRYRMGGYRNGMKIAEACIESPTFPIFGGATLTGCCEIVLRNAGAGVEVSAT